MQLNSLASVAFVRRPFRCVCLGVAMVVIGVLSGCGVPTPPAVDKPAREALPYPSTNLAFAKEALKDQRELAKFSGTSTSQGKVQVIEGEDGRAVLASTLHGRAMGLSYARVDWAVPRLVEGTSWSARFSLFIPHGFLSNKACTFQPFGWDTWPVAGHQMRLMSDGARGSSKMVLRQAFRNSDITPSFELPEGRWVDVEIDQDVSTRRGRTVVRLDGVVVAKSLRPTYTGHPITNFRYGFVDCTGQNRESTIFMRDLTLSWRHDTH